MGRLFEQIKQAVQEDRFLVGWHADERSKERGVTDWQIVSGFKEAELLPDGSEVEVIWSCLAATGEAKLVTVYFRD